MSEIQFGGVSKITEEPTAAFFAWIIPNSDGTIQPEKCVVYWIGESVFASLRVLGRKVYAEKERRLISLFRDGLELVQIDAGQAALIIWNESKKLANGTDDEHGSEFSDVVREQRRTALIFARWMAQLAKKREIGFWVKQ